MIPIVTVTSQRFQNIMFQNLSLNKFLLFFLFDPLISYHQESSIFAKGDENGTYQEGLCSNLFVIHPVYGRALFSFSVNYQTNVPADNSGITAYSVQNKDIYSELVKKKNRLEKLKKKVRA